MRFGVVAVFAALCPVLAYAAPITYTETVLADGTLDGSSFTDALVRVVGTGDTDGALSVMYPDPTVPTLYLNPLTSLTVTVAGSGTDSFSAPSVVFSHGYTAGFTLNYVPPPAFSGADLMFVHDYRFQTYDLATPFGPLVGISPASGNLGLSFATDLGTFSFTKFDSNGTFEASYRRSIPEAPNLPLFVGGLIALYATRSRLWGRRGSHPLFGFPWTAPRGRSQVLFLSPHVLRLPSRSLLKRKRGVDREEVTGCNESITSFSRSWIAALLCLPVTLSNALVKSMMRASSSRAFS